MATLAELRSRVSAKIGLDNDPAGDQVLLDGWINEGVTDVLLRTHCKVLPAEMTLTAGEGDYELDANILATIDAFVGPTSLERVRPEEIMDLRRGGSVGAARYYALAGSNLLMLYPIPNADDTVTIYYVPRPAALSVSSASPDEIPPEFHKAVELYALMEAGDYDDDESSAQGVRYRDDYEKWIRQIRVAMNKKGGNTLAKFQIGVRPRTRLSHPSQDTY